MEKEARKDNHKEEIYRELNLDYQEKADEYRK